MKNVIRFLGFTALIAVITVGAFAQQYDPESDFAVTKNGNNVTITNYKGSKTVVNIPPTIQGGTVTDIGDGKTVPFQGRVSITSVTIPDTVKWIGIPA